jgi:hypothetical protein
MRAVADLIRRAFELGAFQVGPYAAVGDAIRPYMVGVTNNIVLQDGLEVPLWVPVVWNLVLDRLYIVLGPIGFKLFDERVARIHERAKLLAEPDSIDRQFWQLSAMPGPGMLEDSAKRGWSIDIEVTKEEVAALADAIEKEADRIGAEWAAVTGGHQTAGDEPPAVSLTEEERTILETLANEQGTSKSMTASPLCRHEQAIRAIAEALATIESACKLRGRAGLLDLHRSLQRFFCQFLSVAYGLNLIELDNIQSNFPAIDLGDREGRRCFQITSNKSKVKIERTLRKYFAKRLYEQYGAIAILVMGERQRTYKSLLVPVAIQFDPDTDILGLPELIKHVKTLETPTLERLAEIIAAELHIGDRR